MRFERIEAEPLSTAQLRVMAHLLDRGEGWMDVPIPNPGHDSVVLENLRGRGLVAKGGEAMTWRLTERGARRVRAALGGSKRSNEVERLIRAVEAVAVEPMDQAKRERLKGMLAERAGEPWDQAMAVLGAATRLRKAVVEFRQVLL